MTAAGGSLGWLALLDLHTHRFAEILEQEDLQAPIPSCPGWRLHDLADHLGGIHQWAAHAVVAGNPQLEPAPAPPGRLALAIWYQRHAEHLLEVWTTRSATAPAWTMDAADPTAGFWRRRQVHETVMHVWDAQAALGDPDPIDAPLAWDGVLEVVDILYPRQVRLGRLGPPPEALRLTATDVAGQATLGGRGEPEEVRGPAEVLLRLLWGRSEPSSSEISPTAADLLSRALTP